MIEIRNASFRYQSDIAAGGIQSIDLSIPDGQTVVLCGESGCGKTTLTRLINGLIPHYFEGELSGSVTVGGCNVSEQPLYDTARLVGSVFQNPRSQFFNVDYHRLQPNQPCRPQTGFPIRKTNENFHKRSESVAGTDAATYSGQPHEQ